MVTSRTWKMVILAMLVVFSFFWNDFLAILMLWVRDFKPCCLSKMKNEGYCIFDVCYVSKNTKKKKKSYSKMAILELIILKLVIYDLIFRFWWFSLRFSIFELFMISWVRLLVIIHWWTLEVALVCLDHFKHFEYIGWVSWLYIRVRLSSI